MKDHLSELINQSELRFTILYYFVPVGYSNFQAMPVLGINRFLHADILFRY